MIVYVLYDIGTDQIVGIYKQEKDAKDMEESFKCNLIGRFFIEEHTVIE